jgi:hypothetical protein
MCEQYEHLLEEGGTELLNRISPHDPRGDHCAEATDALHDFLRTGIIRPVVAGNLVEYRIHRNVLAGFERIRFENAIRRVVSLGHCRHIVMRATRTNPRPDEERTHYFILANIHDQPVLLDNYGHLIIRRVDRMSEYFRLLIGPCFLEYATRGFDVEADDPLDFSNIDI